MLTPISYNWIGVFFYKENFLSMFLSYDKIVGLVCFFLPVKQYIRETGNTGWRYIGIIKKNFDK